MAAPAHGLVNCSEQKTPETGEPEQEGAGSLKNGTSLEDSDELSGNVGVKNRSPSSASGNQPREMTMENFQDGGTHQPNSRPASANADPSGFSAIIDRQRLNVDFQSFNQSSRDNVNVVSSEDYRNPQENFNHAAVSESGFGGRGGYIGEQHGGQGLAGNTSEMATNSQPNKMYPQYNQQPMRPGFIQAPRNVSLGPQQRPTTNPGMGGYTGNNPQHQRFISGHTISQQTGPTPTLNQLLQAPNPLQRYHNSYEYNPNPGLAKGVGEPTGSSVSQYPGSNSAWTNMRGSPGYSQSMGTSVYRNQGGGPMPEPSMKRPYIAPGQQASAPPAHGQYSQQYQHFSQSQPQAAPTRSMSQNYPHQGQQYALQQTPTNSQVGGYEQRTSTQITSYAQPQAQQDIGGPIDDLPSNPSPTGRSTTPGLRTPTTPPTSQGQSPHPVVSPHRPAPSPSNSSAGSPSMSPALGQQQNIPMPPRPSSSQSENSGQSQMNQSPMTAQGYGQQMAPPPMYGNKLHQGMMGGGSHMGPYSPQTAHYSQSTYHRPPNSMGMQSYGAQNQANYPTPISGTSYPGHSSVNRMASHPSSSSQNFSGPGSGSYINSQYSGSSPAGASGYAMNNMMPPPNQYPKGSMPPPGGAQAAAQAAVLAAANSVRSSPVYLRQHLQQKMYGNNYNSMQTQPVPSSMSVTPGSAGMGSSSGSSSTPSVPTSQESSPMPPPASTPSQMNINQTSPLPPTVSTPGGMGSASGCDGTSISISGAVMDFTQTSAPSVGTPPTTVTQSISSPLPSTAVTVSSPSIIGVGDHSQPHTPQSQLQQQSRVPGSGPQAPPPPPIMDEGSQASNASASSSLPEERVETPKPNNKPPMSHPPTPNTLPSPGAASMSSFHDDFDSVSSPSWPRTPASPVVNNQGYDHHPIKRPDGLLKLYEMSDEPDRRMFLDKLIMYNDERGTPISQCPTISKQPLDLYRLYIAVKERGGFVEVTKGKHWKDVAGAIGIGASSSAAYTLRKQYIKHLLPYECKFDRGGIDPQPIISQVEASSRKKNSKNAAVASQEPYPPPTANQMMDGYPPGSYAGPYPPGSGHHGGMMPNADYPTPTSGHHPPYPSQMPNHTGEGSLDPFTEDMPTSQYQRHNSADTYGYPQGTMNTVMPPYSSTQSSMTGGSYGYSSTSVPQQEQFSDQYPPNMMPVTDSSYSNRGMVQDPYGPPPGGYPPNRTVGQHNPPQYSPYQGPCDQERYEQPQPQQPQQQSQGPLLRPSSQTSTVMGPTQADPSSYQPHRYPGQQLSSQPVTGYQNRPSLSQGQYPSPNSQTSTQSPYPQVKQEPYRGPEGSHNFQNYPPSQQPMYSQPIPPPNKVAPPSSIPQTMYQRDIYPVGSKRHPDYPKSPLPSQDQYHMGTYNQQQSQGPYGDRGQYPYRSSHMMPSSNPGPPPQGWSRENRQYPASAPQGQYPSSQRESWEGSRHGEGPPMTSNNWPVSRYSGNQPESYQPHIGAMGPSVGPKMPLGRGGYMSPTKMAPHTGVGPPPQYTPPPPRKEIVFPPDSVEAVTPVLAKRRRMVSKDVSPLEAWRIMMALKSGLLAESTWALDVLSVLMYDDSTVLYFGLNHLPGLLEVLMDHYRRCLNLIFGLSEDLEVGYDANCHRKNEETTLKQERKWYELENDLIQNDMCTDLELDRDFIKDDKILILDSENYTRKTRCKKLVKTQPEDTLFIFDPDKKWDCNEGFNSGVDHWQLGGGDVTSYIQTHFENINSCVRFVRVMEEVSKNAKDDDECTEDACEENGFSLNCSKDGLCDGLECCKEEQNDPEEDENELKHEETQCQHFVKEKSNFNLNGENVKVEMENLDASRTDEVYQGDDKTRQQDTDEENNLFPRLRPCLPCRKRGILEDLEEEAYNRDEPSLCTTSEAQDSLARRCICISTLLRNLSFVPGNDAEMSKHAGFLLVMGRLLLLHHLHSPRRPPHRHYDRDEEGESCSQADSCSSLSGDKEWWWDMLHILRENTLVTLANITGQLDLAPYPEEISLPLLDGLLHWAVCPSSYAQDPLPTQLPHSVLSPQRLSLEALCKLSILENNVDLMLATPEWPRIRRFFSLLTKWLGRNEDQVMREFSVVLLSNLSQADTGASRAIALQGTCISQLITFVEQAEQSALQVANSQGINALRENPELMGTSLDMVRRAAGTLRCMSRVPENRTLFLQHQQRLLALVMSQILDQGVASIVADVLFECSQQDDSEIPSANSGISTPTTAT